MGVHDVQAARVHRSVENKSVTGEALGMVEDPEEDSLKELGKRFKSWGGSMEQMGGVQINMEKLLMDMGTHSSELASAVGGLV